MCRPSPRGTRPLRPRPSKAARMEIVATTWPLDHDLSLAADPRSAARCRAHARPSKAITRRELVIQRLTATAVAAPD